MLVAAIGSILGSKKIEMSRIIYSIGQGSRRIADFIATLHKHEIRYLCDVRSVPISNHAPEFCAFELKQALSRERIAYVPMGDTLGGRPSDPNAYDQEGFVDYEKLIASESFRAGIARLVSGIEAGHSLTLFCSEGEPERCHRSKAIGRSLQDRGFTVIHINARGEEVSQEDVLSKIAAQLPLLGESRDPRRFSRGRYL